MVSKGVCVCVCADLLSEPVSTGQTVPGPQDAVLWRGALHILHPNRGQPAWGSHSGLLLQGSFTCKCIFVCELDFFETQVSLGTWKQIFSLILRAGMNDKLYALLHCYCWKQYFFHFYYADTSQPGCRCDWFSELTVKSHYFHYLHFYFRYNSKDEFAYLSRYLLFILFLLLLHLCRPSGSPLWMTCVKQECIIVKWLKRSLKDLFPHLAAKTVWRYSHTHTSESRHLCQYLSHTLSAGTTTAACLKCD